MPPDNLRPAPESLHAALLALTDLLSTLDVVHMVVGAVAVAIWGRPRATADLDVAVLTDATGLEALAAALRPHGFEVDPEWVAWNPLLRGQHLRLAGRGLIVDLMRPRDEHDRTAIDRRRTVDIEGRHVAVVSPEDLIVMKLKAGRPHDFDDAVSIVVGHRGRLDERYTADWAARLGLGGELGWVLDAASPE